MPPKAKKAKTGASLKLGKFSKVANHISNNNQSNHSSNKKSRQSDFEDNIVNLAERKLMKSKGVVHHSAPAIRIAEPTFVFNAPVKNNFEFVDNLLEGEAAIAKPVVIAAPLSKKQTQSIRSDNRFGGLDSDEEEEDLRLNIQPATFTFGAPVPSTANEIDDDDL